MWSDSGVCHKYQQHWNKSICIQTGHSQESALLEVNSDLLQAMDKQGVTFLVKDLNACFDSVDHNLFLNRLHSKYEFGKMDFKLPS